MPIVLVVAVLASQIGALIVVHENPAEAAAEVANAAARLVTNVQLAPDPHSAVCVHDPHCIDRPAGCVLFVAADAGGAGLTLELVDADGVVRGREAGARRSGRAAHGGPAAAAAACGNAVQLGCIEPFAVITGAAGACGAALGGASDACTATVNTPCSALHRAPKATLVLRAAAARTGAKAVLSWPCGNAALGPFVLGPALLNGVLRRAVLDGGSGGNIRPEEQQAR